MSENVYKNSSATQSGASFWKGFQRFILFIVITTIVFTALAATYAALRVKTVYTAQESFMVIITIDDSKGNEVNNASLNKKLMGDIKTIILTSGTVELANEKYYDSLVDMSSEDSTDKKKKEADKYIESFGDISSANLSVSYSDESLIATISYSDINKKYNDEIDTYIAEKKLVAYVIAAEEVLSSTSTLPVNSVKFKDMQNKAEISESNSFWKYVLIGFAAGFVLSFAAAVIMKALDSTVRGKDELENICGVAVLSCIDDISD